MRLINDIIFSQVGTVYLSANGLKWFKESINKEVRLLKYLRKYTFQLYWILAFNFVF